MEQKIFFYGERRCYGSNNNIKITTSNFPNQDHGLSLFKFSKI